MSRSLYKVGLVLFVLTMLVSTSEVKASSLADNTISNTFKIARADFSINSGLLLSQPIGDNTTDQSSDNIANKAEVESTNKKDPAKKNTKPKKSKVTKYQVTSGDTLIKIAKKYDTSWTKLYYKNTNLSSPDSLKPGQKIIIPKKGEELKSRPLSTAPVSQAAATQPTNSQPRYQANNQPASAAVPVQTTANPSYANSAGNTYAPGYCTWYVKNRRPDLPNRMGNASSWPSSAAASGFGVGRTPRAGAVAQQGNHVAYVERVNANGTVTLSEMNWVGLFVTSTRTAPASNFTYIY